MDRPRRFAPCLLSALTMAVGMLVAVAPVLAADRSVTISGFAFHPKTTTVNAGDTVTWTNQDGAGHTATGSGFDTGTIASGTSKSVTFNSAGTFNYICTIHPSMTGTLVVRAAGGGTAPNTDMTPLGRADDSGPVTPILAILGVVMLVGTFAADRLLRRKSAS